MSGRRGQKARLPAGRGSPRLHAALVILGGAAALAACSTRIGGSTDTPEGRPCTSTIDCPQPENPCQVWTCWQGACTPVAAAERSLLPREAQTAGDCKLLVCDGKGLTMTLADNADVPPADDNPCADEVCEEGAPAYPPLEAGATCGKAGVCNGRGKCGACLPEAQRCQGNKPETCNEEGAWASEGPCPTATPICVGTACIGVSEVVAGEDFTCGRFEDGQVRCFGEPSSGRLGQEGARRVPGLSGVLQVVAGAEHTCALVDDGTVRCWGSNLFGQLGDDTKEARGVPAPVPGLARVAELAAGISFSCARIEDATAVCWGSNEYGQSGSAPTPAKSGGLVTLAAAGVQDRPAPVGGLSAAAGLALGDTHGCARLADGGVSCWGAGASGKLGRGSPPAAPPKKPGKPAKALPAVRNLKDVVQVAAGGDHACARHSDGSVSCWGRNHHGQLGDGTTKARTGPVKVKDLAGAVGLALGTAHSCARLSDGAVKCWGAGASGQLGDPAKIDHTEPFAVPGLTGVQALSSGGAHLCAGLEDGTFACWGENAHGQLGSGSSGEKPSAILW